MQVTGIEFAWQKKASHMARRCLTAELLDWSRKREKHRLFPFTVHCSPFTGLQRPLQFRVLLVELLRHARLELLEELGMILQFLAPEGGVDPREFRKALPA